MAKLTIISAKKRGDCSGCYFYRPGRTARECIHGGFYTPEECFAAKTIFVKYWSFKGLFQSD